MTERVPKHLAIIMDGNGRWARQRLKNRIFGHRQGIKVVKDVVEHCVDRGIKYLTLYTFSSENWRRPEREVNALMGLLKEYLKKEIPWLLDKDIKLRIIGDISKLPKDVKAVAVDVMACTENCKKTVLNLALSYGGRDEIIRAVKKITDHVHENGIRTELINEDLFESFLDTAGQPEPDLLIRTSGEFRVSNFLLLQMAYTEFYFTETLWPDFTIDELERAFQNYNRRERKFGKV
jgi:undecaprenyl diphosphate synthase